jgi:hypothetical protein
MPRDGPEPIMLATRVPLAAATTSNARQRPRASQFGKHSASPASTIASIRAPSGIGVGRSAVGPAPDGGEGLSRGTEVGVGPTIL